MERFRSPEDHVGAQSLAQLEKPKEIKTKNQLHGSGVTTKPVETAAAFLPLECSLIEGVSLSILLPGQQMQWHQGHTLDRGGPVATGTTSSLLLLCGSSARWVVQDLAIAKCRWGGDCCQAQTSFF